MIRYRVHTPGMGIIVVEVNVVWKSFYRAESALPSCDFDKIQ